MRGDFPFNKTKSSASISQDMEKKRGGRGEGGERSRQAGRQTDRQTDIPFVIPKSVLTTNTNLHSSRGSNPCNCGCLAATAAAEPALALSPCLLSASGPFAQFGAWSSRVSFSSMSDSSLSTGSFSFASRSARRSGEKNSQPRME